MMAKCEKAGDGMVDYIVVGSGAGGGTVAARLARTGYTVALLEAGSAVSTPNYEVPAFYAKASEDPVMRWDYFVRHYEDDEQQKRDSKFVQQECKEGILYPRSGTLGGCTAHHAMVTIRPHDSDWDKIAELTGDESWCAKSMEKHFRQIERCHYVREPKLFWPHKGGHGFTGWMSTQIARPSLLKRDWKGQ